MTPRDKMANLPILARVGFWLEKKPAPFWRLGIWLNHVAFTIVLWQFQRAFIRGLLTHDVNKEGK